MIASTGAVSLGARNPTAYRALPALAVRVIRGALLAACLVLPRGALAQRDPLEARYQRGVALRAERRDADALAVFRAIYDETRAPRALAQVALAEAALGEWVAAEAHLDAALAGAGDSWIRRNRAALEDTRRTIGEHLGDLDVRSATAGATLWIQGREVAALPLARPVRVVAGTVTFEVRAAGRIPVTRVVTVNGGGLVREAVELSSVVAVRETGSAEAAPAPTVVGGPTDAPRGTTQRTFGWVTGAGAGVFLVGATVAYVVGLGDVSRYDGECPPPGTQGISGACTDLLGEIRMLEAVAITGFIGSGALAVTAAALLLTAPPGRGRRAEGRRLSCGRGPGDVGVACRVAF